MKLPVEISPNPLLTSVVEIRFSQAIPIDSILQTFYPILGTEFPKIKSIENNIPSELRKQPQFRHLPDFIFNNDQYSISIGTNAISFENVNSYHLWPNYFNTIKESLLKISNKVSFEKIERLGLRFGSYLGKDHNLIDVINLNIDLGFEGYKQTNNTFIANLSSDDCGINFQILQNAIIHKAGKILNGLLIDIDVFRVTNLTSEIGPTLFKQIDELHTIEKTLFFKTLKSDFINTLNPKY